MADCSAGVRKVLKSEREVERVPPGVADHIALGIAAGAGLVAAHTTLAARPTHAAAGAAPVGRSVRQQWLEGGYGAGIRGGRGVE